MTHTIKCDLTLCTTATPSLVSTMLSDTAIYGVVYSQTRRFAMRNAWSADFHDAMVVMTTTMLKLGYNFHKIMQQINKFVKKTAKPIWTKQHVGTSEYPKQRTQTPIP